LHESGQQDDVRAGDTQDEPYGDVPVVNRKPFGLSLLTVGAITTSSGATQAAEAQAVAVFELSELVILAVVVGAAALALSAALWALAEYQGTLKLRRALRNTAGRARALLSLRDAVLSAGRESVIVWGADTNEPLSFGGADKLLESCLSGPDATQLSTALDALAENGTPFTLIARTPDEGGIAARGRPAGSCAAVFLEQESEVKSGETDFRAAIDALPHPVWVRGKDLALRFVNRAFLSASGASSIESALENDVVLDHSERDLASAVRTENEAVDAKRYAIVGGQRRALDFYLSPLANGSIAGAAIDVTALAEAEARLQQHIDAHAETLDKLATAVAIFGADHKLNFFNRAYVRLWGLSETWLDAHPTEGEILDRLRELRRLPEQSDFRAWKQEHLKLFQSAEDHPEELWHLPGGQTLRVVAQPHPFGGIIFLFEDVSDQLRLESSYNTLIKVQRATLDTLQEGVAVFGPNGRLKLYNAAFSRIWQFESSDLGGEPHLKTLVDVCNARFGSDKMWEIVTNAVTAATPERRREYGESERTDGKILSLTLAPLPDGATLVSFADVTDHFRIESALRERNLALEKTDNIKTEFVKRVSYELRTPLNSIIGFTELLKAGTTGSLSPRQNEYVDAVLSASNTLRDLVNDILDLTRAEAGVMELDLEKLDLHALLQAITEHTRSGAARIGLTLELNCSPDVGIFVADKHRVGQILFNLLSNALKFTPRGGTITVGGDITDEGAIFYVADTGPGIPEDVMPSAFERFSAKAGHGGTRAGAGLGLALVSRFVELHHGWVELQSSPETGTKVTCHLPRNIEVANSADSQPAIQPPAIQAPAIQA
jgi:signal transduction histidine kinase